ncbi:uncharacterized protein [Littorina saxatilis]|uniref:uncharacterized protein n=1 Tax=Littorina saxatilis TaxID=31220 RepID=UPI0038B63DAA
MYWTVTYGNGTVSTIAQCSYCQTNTKTCPKCTITDADFNVTREQNSSTLLIQTNVRQKDGAILTCSKKNNATHSDCKILVLYLEEANIRLHDNWTVTGSVTVSNLPASDNITCLWYDSVNNEMHRLASSAAGLTPYTDSDTDNKYINVSCRLNTTLSPYMVGSNNIFVKILPDGRPFLAATVTVEEPGSLVLDESTCLLSVTEGSHVTCTCKNKDDTQGYPSGRVVWTNNAGSAVLELPDIQQNQGGVVHVCRSLWGPHDEVFDTLNYSVIVNPLDLNQERATGLPVATVVGSVVGFVVIVAIAIFIAVILKRRKSKREATKQRQDSAPTDDG